MSRKILIVEDDVDISRLIALHLGDIDCECTTLSDGLVASQHLQENHGYDMIILDIMLPNCDGLSLCREIRSRDSRIPVMMLTAKTTELDRVLGLEMGADDYLGKPFSFMELTARVKALFRRSDTHITIPLESKPVNHITVDDLSIDLTTREVIVGNKEVSLTAREFELLVHFAQHPGQVFTRTQLLDNVWGYCHEGYEHTVNTHINRLRNKIESNPETPRYIMTVWGVGYQFSRASKTTTSIEKNDSAPANAL